MQEHVKAIVESRWFQTLILGLILVNAAILGAETFEDIKASSGELLLWVDHLILYVFVVEICLRFFAYRGDYFKNGWNIFDFIIVLISLMAATSGLTAIRALRVLRVLRVITVIPRMRVVVTALLDSIPGIASVGLVLVLIVYVFAVIAANIYGPAHETLFGNVFTAMYTLFQVMTLEGWPDIAAQVRETHPGSWMFFLTFVLIATFTMLNLFVAIVVRAAEEDSDPLFAGLKKQNDEIKADIEEIKATLAAQDPRR